MLRLYHSPDSRSSRFIWLLEELSTDYEIKYCNIRRRSGAGNPDPINPHPEKRVPALLHDDLLITEQLAIALYLTDLFPRRVLGVGICDPERAAYLSWLGFWVGEVDPAYNVAMLYGDRLDPMSIRDRDRVTARVARTLENSPYLLGNRFTAVDLFISGPFEWDPGLVAQSSSIADWLKRLASRPAAIRALSRDAPA